MAIGYIMLIITISSMFFEQKGSSFGDHTAEKDTACPWLRSSLVKASSSVSIRSTSGLGLF